MWLLVKHFGIHDLTSAKILPLLNPPLADG